MRSCEELGRIIQPCISREMNDELCRVFSEDEVVEALKDMEPLKASGKDGFPTFFY